MAPGARNVVELLPAYGAESIMPTAGENMQRMWNTVRLFKNGIGVQEVSLETNENSLPRGYPQKALAHSTSGNHTLWR